MDVTGLTHLLVSTLIYLTLATSNSFGAVDDKTCASYSSSVTCPGNVTVQLKNISSVICGNNVNMTCDTGLPSNLICFGWQNGQKTMEGQNQSNLVQMITKKVTFTCTVLCGNITYSSNPIEITCTDQVATILLICGIGAVIIIAMFGITMKIMLKRGEAQRQARRQQRPANQGIDSTATVTSYW